MNPNANRMSLPGQCIRPLQKHVGQPALLFVSDVLPPLRPLESSCELLLLPARVPVIIWVHPISFDLLPMSGSLQSLDRVVVLDCICYETADVLYDGLGI